MELLADLIQTLLDFPLTLPYLIGRSLILLAERLLDLALKREELIERRAKRSRPAP